MWRLSSLASYSVHFLKRYIRPKSVGGAVSTAAVDLRETSDTPLLNQIICECLLDYIKVYLLPSERYVTFKA